MVTNAQQQILTESKNGATVMESACTARFNDAID
jgi:hypothetical protein